MDADLVGVTDQKVHLLDKILL